MPVSNPPDNTQLMVEMAKRQLAKDMPAESKAATIGPMSTTYQLLSGGVPRGVTAVTGPLNGIRYDPDELKGMNQTQVNDVLAHELTHVRQNLRQSSYQNLVDLLMRPFQTELPYGQQPEEMEAFQTERDRSLKEHRPQSMPIPSFQGGKARQNDLTLPDFSKGSK